MSTPAFDAHFPRYLQQAQQARDQNQHHDYRRQLFLAFLTDAFAIPQADVDVERYIQIAQQQVPAAGLARVRKGWIDAIFHDLIFEFKRDLKREEADGLRELRDYLSTIPNGEQCIGLLTDGLQFVTYVLDHSQPHGLRRIDSINFETASQKTVYLWLDAYLLRQSNVPPTSEDIVRRFGLISPTFVAAARTLREALAKFEASETGAFAVKRQQWAFHLARVYGSADVSNNELFVRHTYLCQFAKVLAYAARFGVGEATMRVEGIINGRAFEVLGVGNIGEQDFFAWVLAPEVQALTLDIFRHIAASLIVYDLSQINEDLLKQLYQSLVEPETRHELGEFYTPDWLAELTLREIGYQPGQSLLDPACGSGTFLFTAIRLLVEQGLTGQALVDFALDNIMGTDVHPLAVTIAKINYMLAILPHLRGGTRRGQSRMIPITMANALQLPIKEHHIELVEIPIEGERAFKIPAQAARHPQALAEVLEQMGQYAQSVAQSGKRTNYGAFGDIARQHFPIPADVQDAQTEWVHWNTNASRLTEQIVAGRDSIWVYVLLNTSRPLYLRHRKFDAVVGNPPWIAYRYLQDQTYQAEIKKLMREYALLAPGEMKLHTQMELATLFFEHCRRTYLQPEGTIAFVMPRSVITGAKQHRAFQQRGFTRILDLKAVEPLFSVETCVMIREDEDVSVAAIPTTAFSGRLPAHECSLSQAQPALRHTETITDLSREDAIASPYYFPRMLNGANLYPRNLAFVTSAQPDLAPGEIAVTSIMRTDPDVDHEAKAPWKGLPPLEGHIDDDFLYATLLSKHLAPFGVGRFHLVALPVRVGVPRQRKPLPGETQTPRFIPMSLDEMRETITLARSANEWFAPAEQVWQQHKKTTTRETLAQWFNYQNKLTAQSAEPGSLLLYGATGTSLAAAVIETHDLPVINGARPRAFVVDHKTYWYRAASADEGHFLAALLNAPCVDAAIKTSQTRGLFGARDIHRRPFEVCAIPQFDEQNPDHQQLAAMSKAAHCAVAELDLAHTGVVQARKQARQVARAWIEQIDVLAQRLLGLSAVTDGGQEDEEREAG